MFNEMLNEAIECISQGFLKESHIHSLAFFHQLEILKNHKILSSLSIKGPSLSETRFIECSLNII